MDPDATEALPDGGDLPQGTPAGSSGTSQSGLPPGIPRRFDHYEILVRQDGSLHELGRGAMGITYKALDTRLHCHVALKVVSSALLARYPDARERFLREARAAARLRHPNIASVFHLGEVGDDACAFYAMEFIEGETLQERVARDGPLPAPVVLELGMEAARALIAANQQGFIHRDLKPANLMLVAKRATEPGNENNSTSGEARLKVIDFGLAKMAADAGPLTCPDHFLGTPQYASPEQFAGAGTTPDTRSDIYSLGATLWYALAGRHPFTGRSLDEMYARKRRPPPADQLPAGVPPCLATLLTGTLAADPADRPQTPYVLLEEMRRCHAMLSPAAVALPPLPPRNHAKRRLAAGIGTLVLAALALATWKLSHDVARRPASAPLAVVVEEPPFAPPEKSIAVLPFKNLSNDPSDRFFADAVQDEILLNLAHVADLKVISRTSVLDYRDAGSGGQSGVAPRNLPRIARAVGVAHIVEGSVQRVGSQIRVSADLIDTRTDTHVWADAYKRPLDDIFAVQSEIAQAIAGQLRAKISPQEKASLDAAPTHNLAAYKLYRQTWQEWNESDVDSQALFASLTGRLRQALALDPEFVRARLLLVNLLAFVYRNGYEDPTQAAGNVRAEVEEILRQRPGSGEAHHAAGFYEYYVRLDYERARQEFSLAVRTLPNDPEVHLLLGLIGRRQNRWDDALAEIDQAALLDPANADVLWKRVVVLSALRRYDEARHQLDAYIAAHPGVIWTVRRAELALDERAETEPLRLALERVPAEFDPEGEITKARFYLALHTRDFDGAARLLAASPRRTFPGELPVQSFSREFMECLLAHARGDEPGARERAAVALPNALEVLATRPDDPARMMVVATLQAALGHRGEALEIGRRAVVLAPISKDAFLGPQVASQFARVLVWIGERSEALDLLAELAPRPQGPTYGNLRLSVDWEPLRDDPRFEAMIAAHSLSNKIR